MPTFMSQPVSIVGKGVPYYEGYTFSAFNPENDSKTKRWEKAHKERMMKDQPELGAMVRQERDRGKNVTDVYKSENMRGSKHSHIERLLQERNMTDPDGQYSGSSP